MLDLVDLPEILRSAAKEIRETATAALNEGDDCTVCCWDTQMIGGQESVIEVRNYADGTDHEVVAVPVTGGVARHIAGAHPKVMLRVADVLESQADAFEALPVTARGTELARQLLAICDAYVVSRHA